MAAKPHCLPREKVPNSFALTATKKTTFLKDVIDIFCTSWANMPLLAVVQQDGTPPALRLPVQVQLVDVSQTKLACCP